MERIALATRDQRHWQHLEEDKVTKQIRKQRIEAPGAGQARRRDWTNQYQESPELFEDIDLPDHVRVMARGEAERRKVNWERALEGLEREYAPNAEAPLAIPAQEAAVTSFALDGSPVRGTVVEVSPGACQVASGGRSVACRLRASLKASEQTTTNVVAVGDQVLIALNDRKQAREGDAERGVVTQVLPRQSALMRPDPFYPHLHQVIAANIDQLLIVASWRDPAWWPELLDRYLIAAERNRLSPIICINKVDLASARIEPQAALEPYERLTYRMLFTSAHTGEGLTELADLLQGRMTALAGLSGVGKSSLLAEVEPGLELRTGEVSARRHEGRHTTTQVTLHRLGSGGFVIDTPGIREFGLSGLRQTNLPAFYGEFSDIGAHCRFADCAHLNEPGCAVRLAVRDGRVSAVRYDNYRKIRRSLPP
jgi:ribosome biogenesis GTPase